MSTGAEAGLDVFRNPEALWMKGGDSTSTWPPMAAERMSTVVGPGRPLTACLIAICVPRTASLGLVARVVYLVMDLKMDCRSMLPYSPAPDWLAGRWAAPPSDVSVITNMGELLSMASMMPNVALEPMNSP